MIDMLFRNLKNLLILSFFISGGCQLTQSNVSVKETVRNTQQEIKDESQPEELNESENADIDEINTKDEISELPEKKLQLSDKKDEDKRILDFFSDIFKPKEKQETKNDLVIKDTKANLSNNKSDEQSISKDLVNNRKNEGLYNQAKPKDDKRILDFFTNFFGKEENKVEKEITLKEPSKIETEGLQKPAKLVEEEPSKIETEGLQKSAKLVEDEILKIEESIIEEDVQEKLEDDA